MAFVHGRNARVILGTFSVSGYANEDNVERMVDIADTSVFGVDAHQSIPGLQSSKVGLGGFLDPTQDEALDATIAVLGGKVVSSGVDGFALGKHTFHCEALTGNYTTNSSVENAVTWKLDLTATGVLDHNGRSLADLAQVAIDTLGASLDNTTTSANGGAGILHVTEFTDLDTAVFKVQHSTNNSTWVDLVTFTTATNVTSERVVVVPGTTVNRYLRATADVTGTGTVTYQISFARR